MPKRKPKKLHRRITSTRQLKTKKRYSRKAWPRYRGEPKLKKKADRFAFLDVAGLTGSDVPKGEWNR